MSTPTFEEQVNTVVSKMTQGEDGNWEFPEDLEADDSVKYAANLERRRRDTQASFTKSQQENERLKAENDQLATSWEQDVVSTLSAKEQSRLEELKGSNPDEWRKQLAKLEDDKKEDFKKKRSDVTKKATQETELQRRERVLEEFNEQNPDFKLTDEVIENDIPPRLTKLLASGDLTFEDFLEKAKKFVTTPKKVKGKGEKAEEEIDLSKLPGSDKPGEEAVGKDIKNSYKNEVF